MRASHMRWGANYGVPQFSYYSEMRWLPRVIQVCVTCSDLEMASPRRCTIRKTTEGLYTRMYIEMRLYLLKCQSLFRRWNLFCAYPFKIYVLALNSFLYLRNSCRFISMQYRFEKSLYFIHWLWMVFDIVFTLN